MWTEGTIRVGASVFHYWVKHYEEPSTCLLYTSDAADE